MANNGRTKTFGLGPDVIDLRLPQGAFGIEGFFDNANAGSGNDTLQGNGADNRLNGDGGNDRMLGDFGNDTMNGGSGKDRMFGELGRDSMAGGNGADTLDGGLDNDTLSGGTGNDRLLGGLGNDRMAGDAGNDWMEGDYGRDTLSGGTGNDTVHSNTGADRLFGDAGNDLFFYNDLLSNQMVTQQVRVDGGAGEDTVALKGQVLPVVNIGAEAEPVLRMWDAPTGIERIDIERDSGNQTLTFGQGDVRRMSDTDVVTVDGDVGDHVHLFAIPTGDILEGSWVQRADQVIGGETFNVFAFELFGPAGSIATVRIDSDVGVSLF